MGSIEFRKFDHAPLGCREIGCEVDAVGFKRDVKIGARHGFIRPDAIDKGLELRLVGVIGHVARIDQRGFQGAPFVFAHAVQFVGVDAVVEQAAFRADEVNVEVIGLQTIHARSDFCRIAIGEFEEGDRGGVVLVGLENGGLGFGGQAGHFLDLAIHEEQARIEGVATGGEQAGAGKVFFDIPFKLPVPRANAVVVIDFAVVQFPEQALVDDGADHGKVRAKAAFKADAGLHARGANGIAHPFEVVVRQADGFFDDQVLARFGSRDRLVRVKFVGRADVDDVNVGIRDHVLVILVRFEGQTVLRGEGVFAVVATRTDRRHTRAIDRFERVDVRPSYPAEPDDADVEITHNYLREWIAETSMATRDMNLQFVENVNTNERLSH